MTPLNKALRITVLLTPVLLAAGCAKPPTADLQVAQNSLGQAKSTGAEAYAPEAFTKAQQTFEQAKAEVAAQDGRFALLRSYGKARALLTQARTDADQAKVKAVAGKEQFKGLAQVSLDQARLALETAKTSLSSAPTGKDSRADLEAMKGDLEGLGTALADADTAFATGDYAASKQKTDQILEQAKAIEADIARARAKFAAR